MNLIPRIEYDLEEGGILDDFFETGFFRFASPAAPNIHEYAPRVKRFEKTRFRITECIHSPPSSCTRNNSIARMYSSRLADSRDRAIRS